MIKSIVFCVILCMALSCTDDTASIDPDELEDVVTIEPLTTDPLLADGIDSVTVTAVLDPKDVDVKTITFATSLGSFSRTENVQSTTKDAQNGVAMVTLYAGVTPGTAHIKASILEFSATASVKFTCATPDNVLLETDHGVATIDGSKQPVITAHFLRNPDAAGAESFVSAGMEIGYSATRMERPKDTVGRFAMLDQRFTDTSGIARIRFAADTGDLAPGDAVNIRVWAPNDTCDESKEPVEKSLQLRIEP